MNPEELTNEVGNYLNPLLEQIILYIPKMIAAVIIFIVTLYVGALIAKAVRRAAERPHGDLPSRVASLR